MRIVRHPNIVELKAFYYSNGDRVRELDNLMGVQTALIAAQKDEVYLNLVLEFVPETVYRASRHFNKLKTTMPILEVKLYIYQLFRSLAYIHSQGICHRDIKPQNLLLDPQSGVLKLCDFGSAKILVENEPNVSYICSRYYRAPELIFGATNYTTKIGESSHLNRFAIESLLTNSRRLVHRLRDGRTNAWATALPRRVRDRSVSRDYQSTRNSDSRSDSHDESKLHGAQVSTDQTASV